MSSQSLRCVALLLLCCACLCAESPTPRRQKRGIMKMMMHIMWDPVRLIRYWYAYDVTKEIAKSWRKIIPTILLMPFSPHPLAKYVHPTIGLRDSHKGSAELPDHAFQAVPYDHPQLSGSSSNVDQVPINFQQPSGGVRYMSLPAQGLEGMKDAHHFLLQPVHQEYLSGSFVQSSERKDEHSFKKVPIPYKIGIPNGNHNFLKGIPLPLHNAVVQFSTDVKDGTDQSASLENSGAENVHAYPHLRVRQQNYAGPPPESLPYSAFEKVQSYPSNQQEIHIVLHPIPVSDPDRYRKAGANGFHFVPFYPNATDFNSHFVFPNHEPPVEEAPQNIVAENDTHGQITGSDPKQNDSLFLDLKDHNISSSEMYDARPTSRVIWMLKRDPGNHQSKKTDHQSAESAHKVNSVHRAYEDGHENRKRENNSSESSSSHHPRQLNRLNIDMVQLKEDLKHGTPVFIPFNKKVLYPTKSNCRESATESKEAATTYPKTSTETEDVRSTSDRKEPIVYNFSGERFEDSNSTQRLLLFLAKKQSSHHPG